MIKTQLPGSVDPCWPQFEAIQTKLEPLPFIQVGHTTQRRACSYFFPRNHILTVNRLCSGCIKVKYMLMYSFYKLSESRQKVVRMLSGSFTHY